MVKTYKDFVEEVKTNIKEIDIGGLVALDPSAHILIDIRETAEIEKGTLPNAKHLARGVLEGGIGDLLAAENAHDKAIVLYCRSGARSAFSAESLQRMGYEKVYSLAGGILAWEAANQATP